MAEYNEIKNLSPKEHIRIRSGMYIGDKSTPNHLFTEVLDNAIDEAIAGYAKDIIIKIEEDHFSVEDTGRGLPIGKNSDGESYVSVAFTKINSGGKYDNGAYTVSSGCFTGDTKVRLADGRDITFIELLNEYKNGKANYVYTSTSDGEISIQKIRNVTITKEVKRLCKLTLDNNEEILSTVDHPYLTKSGDLVEVQDLKVGDSLMPGRFSEYTGSSKLYYGREVIYDNKHNKNVLTYHLADEYNLKHNIYDDSKPIRHHVDFNKLNNNPDNIIRLTNSEHNKLHNKDSYEKKYGWYSEGDMCEFVEFFDYKVKKVEILELKEKVPVYDLTVDTDDDDLHHFLLSAGVFVHNTNGVGIKAVNFLSDRMEVWTYRDGIDTRLITENGDIVSEVVTDNTVKKKFHGTIVTCYPLTKWKNPITEEEFDNFFESNELDFEKILDRLNIVKVLLPSTRISLQHYKDERFKELTEIKGYTDEELCPDCNKVSTIENSIKGHDGEYFIIKFGYTDKNIKYTWNTSGVNMLKVLDGAHLRAADLAIREAWLSYVDKDTKNFLHEEDYTAGLRLSVFVNLRTPAYTSQTKEKLAGNINTEYKYLVDAFKKEFETWIWNPSNRELVQGLVTRMQMIRTRLNQASDTKIIEKEIVLGSSDGIVSRKLDPNSKLVDCTSKDREGTELFLAEGDSAGGTLISKRNNKIHAVLPLRGKVLNVIDRDTKRILENQEMKSLINAIGIGCLSKVDISRCRYDKVVIVTDQDSDGYQIRALLIGAFAYLMPELIQAGKLFICEVPLFLQKDEKGNLIKVYKEEDLDKSKPYSRYKGLGSYKPEHLYRFVYDKEERNLKQITLDDVEECVKIVGWGDYRKEFLIKSGVISE